MGGTPMSHSFPGAEGQVSTYHGVPANWQRRALPVSLAFDAIGQAIARQWFAFVLAGIVLIWYAPSVHFGLIWDDPRWYQQGAGRSFWQILTSLSTYQFYRPLAIWLNQQLVSPTGVVNVTLAHLIQINAHLIVVLATFPLLRAFGFSLWHARLTALLLAIHPFGYQAVAWQAPQQPLAMMFVILSLLAAASFAQNRQPLLLALSLCAYLVGLFFQESVLPFVFLFPWLAWSKGKSSPLARKLALWPLLYIALAMGFVFLWLHVPRAQGITGTGFEPVVLGYLLQALAIPLARGIAVAGLDLPLAAQLAIYLALWLLLALGLVKTGKGRAALFASLWIIAGVLPVWAGLSWEYVQVGSRLAYPTLVGVAGLWAGCLTWLFGKKNSKTLRILAAITALLLLIISVDEWHRFERLYQTGTRHLTRAISTMSNSPQSRILLVNFPDRIEMKSAEYPLGFWGLTLAPVVQDLSDYALATTGHSAETRSIAHFLTGADMRETWPYRVDMRGENQEGDDLYAAFAWADAIYLTDYMPDGSLRLRQVGSITSNEYTDFLVSFGERLQLTNAEIVQDAATPTSWQIHLVWHSIGPMQSGDTIFVHLLTEDGHYVAGCDGDSLGGMLPLSAWPPSITVQEEREFQLAGLPAGQYMVTVGIYNRESGARYRALQPNGAPIYNDEFVIQRITLSTPAPDRNKSAA